MFRKLKDWLIRRELKQQIFELELKKQNVDTIEKNLLEETEEVIKQKKAYTEVTRSYKTLIKSLASVNPHFEGFAIENYAPSQVRKHLEKQHYGSKEAARYASLYLYYKEGRRLKPYQCQVCTGWCLTKCDQPPAVAESEDDFYREDGDGRMVFSLADLMNKK